MSRSGKLLFLSALNLGSGLYIVVLVIIAMSEYYKNYSTFGGLIFAAVIPLIFVAMATLGCCIVLKGILYFIELIVGESIAIAQEDDHQASLDQ